MSTFDCRSTQSILIFYCLALILTPDKLANSAISATAQTSLHCLCVVFLTPSFPARSRLPVVSFCLRETDAVGTPVPFSSYCCVAITMSNAMSNAQRRRRDEGWSPRRRAESLGAERHNRGHDRRLVPGLAHSAASRKRPTSPRGVFSSGRVYVLTWLVGMMGIGRGRVSAQYVDGGKVSMDCADCSCSGSSDDGTIDVFRSPSSGELVRAREWFIACETERERERDVAVPIVHMFVVMSLFLQEAYDASFYFRRKRRL